MKVYIAGPMTGYEDWNRPAFRAAADHLRVLGYQVVNPADLDDDIPDSELGNLPHEFFMRRDLAALLGCEAIYLLPGWAHSRGASLEAKVAEETGILRLEEHNVELWRTFEGEPLDMDRVAEVLDRAEEPDPIDHRAECQPVQGDGTGNEWCAHGSQVATAHTPPPNGRINLVVNPLPSYMAEYLAAHGNAIDRSIDEHHRR